MQLRCLGFYSHGPRQLRYTPGQVFDADAGLASFLMADAPGCFTEELPAPAPVADDPPVEGKQLDAPPRHRAITGPPKEK